jgi:CubicO group peptidase (beta-lactamase class C family)
MMHARTFSVAATLAVSTAATALPAQAPAPALSPERQVDALFAPWDRPGSPGAAVAVVRDGQVVLARGYGYANLEYDVPITPSTIFHVASVSKQFTAFAAALLAEQGVLSLDDDVRRWVPEVPDFGHTITLRHLIHHTSGLRDQWELLALAGWRLDDVITRDQIFKLLLQQRELNFAPGAEYMYSNMGYTLLAEIVSRAGGEPFPAWMKRHVFAPLGMRATHFHDDHQRLVPGRAYSYAPTADGGYRHAVLSYANVGATSLFTTVEDLARWIANLESPRVGGPAAMAEMRTRGVLSGGDTIPYGFALVHQEHRGLPIVQHGGADAGFRAFLMYFPEECLGVLVLSNVADFNPGSMASRVAEVYLGDRMEPAPPPPPPPAPAEAYAPPPLAPFAGRYHSPELGVEWRIEERDGALTLVHPRHPDMGLRAVGPDTFAVYAEAGTLPGAWSSGYFRLALERDEAGAVRGMRASSGRIRHLWFARVE